MDITLKRHGKKGLIKKLIMDTNNPKQRFFIDELRVDALQLSKELNIPEDNIEVELEFDSSVLGTFVYAYFYEVEEKKWSKLMENVGNKGK